MCLNDMKTLASLCLHLRRRPRSFSFIWFCVFIDLLCESVQVWAADLVHFQLGHFFHVGCWTQRWHRKRKSGILRQIYCATQVHKTQAIRKISISLLCIKFYQIYILTFGNGGLCNSCHTESHLHIRSTERTTFNIAYHVQSESLGQILKNLTTKVV